MNLPELSTWSSVSVISPEITNQIHSLKKLFKSTNNIVDNLSIELQYLSIRYISRNLNVLLPNTKEVSLFKYAVSIDVYFLFATFIKHAV